LPFKTPCRSRKESKHEAIKERQNGQPACIALPAGGTAPLHHLREGSEARPGAEMWRLRVAEDGGGGGGGLRTKNGHVGRQVWEFDAAADPDPAVDAARQAFVDTRHHLKHSADLLMRIQVGPVVYIVFGRGC